MSLDKIMTESRRLSILRVLEADKGYSVNDSVMREVIDQFGHTVSRDQVRTDFAWLAEQDLVTVEVVNETVHVAKLTARGADVANGRAIVPGVKRPSPD